MDLGDAAQSTSRDLWMEVMLKLVTVAIVQAWVAIACCMYTAYSWCFLLEVNGAVQAVACSTATSVPWHQTVKR